MYPATTYCTSSSQHITHTMLFLRYISNVAHCNLEVDRYDTTKSFTIYDDDVLIPTHTHSYFPDENEPLQTAHSSVSLISFQLHISLSFHSVVCNERKNEIFCVLFPSHLERYHWWIDGFGKPARRTRIDSDRWSPRRSTTTYGREKVLVW